MFRWESDHTVTLDRPEGVQWLWVAVRLFAMAITIFGLMVPLFLARLIRLNRLGDRIVWIACRISLRIMGIKTNIVGRPVSGAGVLVANHSSWLDIFSLNASLPLTFVAKADVSGWPVLGPISRSTGTLFIERKVTQAQKHNQAVQARLAQGERLVIFPEGTCSDGRRVLPFRSSLFGALSQPGRIIQPITLHYVAPKEARKDYYGWWGDMGFAEHFFMVLARRKQGRINVIFHLPLCVDDFADRKALALAAEQAVRQGLPVSVTGL